MVSAQMSASYSRDADPVSTKATAGKGNSVNPLETSPATPELSAHVTKIVSSFLFCFLGVAGNGQKLIFIA